MYKIFFKFISIYFLYFLVLSNSLNINYKYDEKDSEISKLVQSSIKLRPIYTGLVINNGLNFIDLADFNEFKLLSSKDIITFEFQDTRDKKVYKSNEYVLWNYKDVYKNYINNLNSNLIYNSEW